MRRRDSKHGHVDLVGNIHRIRAALEWLVGVDVNGRPNNELYSQGVWLFVEFAVDNMVKLDILEHKHDKWQAKAKGQAPEQQRRPGGLCARKGLNEEDRLPKIAEDVARQGKEGNEEAHVPRTSKQKRGLCALFYSSLWSSEQYSNFNCSAFCLLYQVQQAWGGGYGVGDPDHF